MVGDFQDKMTERLPPCQERPFPFLLQVSGEEERGQPPVEAEDEGVVVLVGGRAA